MLPTSLVPLLEVLKTVPGIRAIVVGGSRARGSWDAVSDTDLGLYYHPQYPPAIESNRVWSLRLEAGDHGLMEAVGRYIRRHFVESKRSDVSYVAGCLFQVVGALLMVLFALNRVYWLNEKGALRFTDRFQIVPARFRERVERMWESVRKDPDSLESALGIAREPNEEVTVLVQPEGLSL